LPIAPRLLGEEDAARYAGVSRWSIRALIDAGTLPTVKLPGANGDMRRILIDRADLDALIERSKDPA
jgi:excisionase family DNA binding protein